MWRIAVFVVVALGCGTETSTPAVGTPVAVVAEKPPEVVGTWRATLASPGGELPFAVQFERAGQAPLTAFVINGPERIAVSSVAFEGRELVMRFDPYDSEIRATGTSESLAGRWVKTGPDGPVSMRFVAKRGEAPRFGGPVKMPKHNVPVSIDGDWAVVFTEDDGKTFPARAIFVAAEPRIDATFMTETGDYRYLDGRYKQGFLELSCFDGAHAFLFRGAIDAQGALAGDFWSRASYHAKWKAVRMNAGDDSPIADPFTIVSSTTPTEPLEFAFPDLEGKLVRHDDPRWQGKVVVLELFGTWCPNCNDYAPLLSAWDREYRDRGLQIVGVAFEMTGEPERDRKFVRQYGEKYGIEFPLLLGGNSDKEAAAKLFPALSKVDAYPTTILIGRDGRVRKIHSGFAGPATGRHHVEMVASLRAELETLLAEPEGAVERPTTP